MKKSTVAILKTNPKNVFDDIHRLMEMAGLKEAMDKTNTTILGRPLEGRSIKRNDDLSI